MRVASVNVSAVREVEYRGRIVPTGIFKQPVSGRVAVKPLGLAGDDQADKRVHGGPDKAVYVYPQEHYPYWSETLGVAPFPPGQFGENLTVEGCLETDVRIGDRFRIGSCTVEVSQPRAPCFKLAMRMERPDFARAFLHSGRVGFYLRVIETGDVAAGDAIERVETDPQWLSVADVSRLYYIDRDDTEGARRAAALDRLSPGWREEFAGRLAG